jgi:hypothetical protein
VAFYVPLGPRGLLFRLGTLVIGVWGGLVYRLAYRRRTIVTSHPRVSPVRFDDVEGHHPFDLPPSLPDVLLQAGILSEGEAAVLA